MKSLGRLLASHLNSEGQRNVPGGDSFSSCLAVPLTAKESTNPPPIHHADTSLTHRPHHTQTDQAPWASFIAPKRRSKPAVQLGSEQINKHMAVPAGFKNGPVIPAGQGGFLLRLAASVWGYSSMLLGFFLSWFFQVRGLDGTARVQCMCKHVPCLSPPTHPPPTHPPKRSSPWCSSAPSSLQKKTASFT